MSITLTAILAAAQKGGRILLTFLEERRRRLAKARQEGYKDAVDALSQNPRIAAILREDPRILERVRRELGIDPPARENGGG